ncbi:MAG TPA: hypothetical protein VFG87_07760 [Amycolatopsis sp.]|nr:hypothetical protein [Amycolatopsis sp.]
MSTMSPIVEEMAALAPTPRIEQAPWWSFALGADSGGSGSAVAASANVVALGIAARSGHRIGFW